MGAVVEGVDPGAAETRHQMLVALQAMAPHAEQLKALTKCLPENEQTYELRAMVTALLFRLTVLENRASQL